jgi:NAD(P)H-dependent flavin oxidoreductase YrpB (nitropropane dioxygenase family)
MSSHESYNRPSRRSVLKAAGTGIGAAILSHASRTAADRSHGLETRLSRELGLRLPLASAGMAFVGLTDLAAAVSNAGALGVYGVGADPPPVFAARVQAIQAQTSAPFGVDFIVATSPLGTFTTQDHIDLAAAVHVPVVVFHWNLPDPGWVSQLHAAGSKVWIQTGDVDIARQGVALGVDGVVAQGRSAGGHNRNSTIPTLGVVEMMRRALPPEIFILAAGGIADGHSLVRALRAGADGGWAGTVFVAAEESYAHADYKARLVAASSPHATQFTTVFGPEWPGQQQRVLRNRATADPTSTTPATIGNTLLFPGVLNVPYTMPKFSAIVPTRDTTGDLDEMDMPAGAASVRAVRRVRPAAEIVAEFIAGGREAAEHDADRDASDDE